MADVYMVTRTSTNHQDLSIEAQDAALRKWAMNHGHIVKGISTEDGVSGGRDIKKRHIMKILNKMGKGDILATYSWSRLTRSLSDLMEIAKILEKKGSHLVSIVEQIDTSTPQGRLFYHIMGSMHQFERELIAQRVRFGLDHKRSKSEKLGGMIPFGYDVKVVPGMNRKGEPTKIKKLVPNEKEHFIIEKILTLRRESCTLKNIANTLNAEGIPTKNGSVWLSGQINRIVRREARA